MEERNDFYVYIHTRATHGTIFYVGKGKGKRAWSKFNRNKHWKHIVAKYGYNVVIVQEDLTEEQAFMLEKEIITALGKENLCNLTDGGEGVSGLVHSKVTRKKMSEAKKGHTYNKGRKLPPLSEERRRKISEFSKAMRHTEETKKK